MLGLLMVKPFLYWAQKSQTASLKRYRLQDDSQNCCCHIQINTKLGVNTKVSIYRAYMLSSLLCKEVASHGAPMLNNKDDSTTSTSTASLVQREDEHHPAEGEGKEREERKITEFNTTLCHLLYNCTKGSKDNNVSHTRC